MAAGVYRPTAEPGPTPRGKPRGDGDRPGFRVTLTTMILLLLALPQVDLSALPVRERAPARVDWLVEAAPLEAGVFRDGDGRHLVLDNGLVRREFRVADNLGCVAFDDLSCGRSLLRAVRPEARLVVNGVTLDVGGLVGQTNHAYLDPSLELSADPQAMVWVGFEVGVPAARLDWKPTRRHGPHAVWPPAGVALRLDFALSPDDPRPAARALEGLRVAVHYELYDGLPLVQKWVTVTAPAERGITVERLLSELAAVVEHDSRVEARPDVPLPTPDWMHVETDYAMGGDTTDNACRHAVRWVSDPQFHTQVNYRLQTPCMLEVGPERGPDQDLAAGETFTSLRTFELVEDGADRTRRSLARARMYETIAPWVTENPLMMHVRNSDEASVRAAIQQCVDVGFEMLILTFGSGFNMEDDSPANLERWKRMADLAHENGVQIGGYSLLSSRRIQPDGDNCLNPLTGKPGGQIHGTCPALASGWGLRYFERLRNFLEFTGFDLLEHDGPYPGDLDAAARPPLQKGVEDSRWVQWSLSADFYGWCRARGIYLNAPDWYYLVGSNKCGMGYREVNWSLPRAQQVIHTRQNVFDGTRHRRPSMGWMFVPLSQYHGGGAAATVEPLSEHRDHYRRMLESNLGAGVQACYRGPRLYDDGRVRDLVAEQVAWFKSHRDILEAPVVHSASRRADGRGLDWLLHADPRLAERGMLCVYNPLDRPVTEPVAPSLYYTGLVDSALVSHRDGPPERMELDHRQRLELQVTVPAGGMTWYVFR
jgi:hypothetical protein